MASCRVSAYARRPSSAGANPVPCFAALARNDRIRVQQSPTEVATQRPNDAAMLPRRRITIDQALRLARRDRDAQSKDCEEPGPPPSRDSGQTAAGSRPPKENDPKEKERSRRNCGKRRRGSWGTSMLGDDGADRGTRCAGNSASRQSLYDIQSSLLGNDNVDAPIWDERNSLKLGPPTLPRLIIRRNCTLKLRH